METLLSGKTVLITGGTSELGSAFTRKALKSGAQVSFTHFKSAEKAKELEALGACGYKMDLTNAKAMDAFLDSFKKEHPALDILIHNAAVAADGIIEKLSEADWDRVIAADLKAPFYITQKLLPVLKEKKPSKVLMMVSQAGLNGLWGAANYAAAKGGLIHITKALAEELGPENVLVNAVNPGFMKSRLTEGLPEQVIQKALNRSPLKTLSNPDEVAGFLVYLCSDLVKQVTGQVFHFESRPL